MKRKSIVCVLAALAVVFAVSAALDGQMRTLSHKVVRLHVVGADDSYEEQQLKLLIKDRVLEEIQPILNGVSDREDAISVISQRLPEIVRAAADEAGKYGGRKITGQIKTEPFPTKGYDTFSLPGGYYTALKITIGEGQGHNWWCVVYPNVCTDSVTEEEDFYEKGFTEDETELMCGDVKIKFRLIEFIEKIKTAIFK